MVNAARVARTFRMDPLQVLAGADPIGSVLIDPMHAWAIRMACHETVCRDESPEDRPLESGMEMY